MPERLVDVQRPSGQVLHTFPVKVRDPEVETEEEACKRRALEAAAFAKLVRNEELDTLEAKIHPDRGGQLTPYGDRLGVLAETKEGLEQLVRERAYSLWEQTGRPDGRADEFWYQVEHQCFCERAYALWERDGRPEGRADEHWYRTRAFYEES